MITISGHVILVTSVLSQLLMAVVPVAAYDDLRGQKCLRDDILHAIPHNRAEWDGYISLAFACDPGFDFPLNVPPFAEIRCFFNRSWTPDFLPDCNRLVLPTMVWLKTSLLLRLNSDDKSKPVGDTRSAAKSPFDSMTVESACKDLGWKCKTIRKTLPFACDTKDSADCLPERNKASNFTMNVSVSLAFTTKRTYSDYTNGGVLNVFLQNIVKAIPSSHTLLVNPKAKVKFDCPESAVPILSPQNDQVRCRGCSVAHRIDRDKKVCIPCPHGHYQDEPLSTKCKPCPNIHFITDKESWAQIRQKSMNRLKSIRLCPVIRRLRDGTLSISPNLNEDPWANANITRNTARSQGEFSKTITTLCTVIAFIIVICEMCFPA